MTNVAFEAADVFHHLADLVAIRRQFDVVILDPPKFARNARGAGGPGAIAACIGSPSSCWRRDGVLVSCCCTGLITLRNSKT